MLFKPLAWCLAHIKLLINVSYYYCLLHSHNSHSMSDKPLTSSAPEGGILLDQISHVNRHPPERNKDAEKRLEFLRTQDSMRGNESESL